MSRKKNRNRGKPQAPQPKATPVQPSIDPKKTDIEMAHDEALATATDEDISAIGSEPKPHGADHDTLWEMVREARDIFRSAARRAEEASGEAEGVRRRQDARAEELDARESAITDRDVQVSAREEALDARVLELAGTAETLDKRESTVADRELAFTDREAEIRKREINAEAGFVVERKAMLAALDESVEDLRATLGATEREIADKCKAWHEEEKAARSELRDHLDAEREQFNKELADARATEQARLDAHERALNDREGQLAKDRADLESAKRRLAYDEEDLAELRADLDKRVEQRSATVREELEHRIRALEAQLTQARSDRDAHEELLRRREEADRKFGQRTPEEVLAELDLLRGERSKLKADLAERPDADGAAHLASLEKEQEAWQAERTDLRRQVSDLKRRLAYSDVDANEREVQRDLLTSMESQRQLLFEAHRQIRTEIDDLLSRSEAKSPFPACSAMDTNTELQTAGPMTDGIDDLQVFVEDLQHRIAFDPDHPDRQLFYTLADLRSFLGGLAMSPLVLLQGISGTGKTSLPVAFARAVGTKAAVIEVQAGWRDPQDLAGHYNVFEKRFYEKEFLKALYQARTPRWADAIHIVLLDEMNLAHPEQYFSDLLSALELRPESRRLVLMPHAIEPAPDLFIEGSKLPIPPNVWFVGTANHDETTKDFADKTYDRAHVMQFPHRPETFDISRPSPRPPVSVAAIQKAFDVAASRRRASAEKALGFLESEVRAPLADYFEVGWGPRLERQMRRYVPVVVAAGGTVGEATDHVLAMRLLRKIKNRHDNRPEHLEALRQRIEESWPGLDKKSKPSRSVELLVSELRRLGRAPENGA